MTTERKNKLHRRVLRLILIKLCVCKPLNREGIWEEFKFFAKCFEIKSTANGDFLDIALGMIGFDTIENLGANVEELKGFLAADMIEMFDLTLKELEGVK
jgi:hypothetical protein